MNKKEEIKKTAIEMCKKIYTINYKDLPPESQTMIDNFAAWHIEKMEPLILSAQETIKIFRKYNRKIEANERMIFEKFLEILNKYKKFSEGCYNRYQSIK